MKTLAIAATGLLAASLLAPAALASTGPSARAAFTEAPGDKGYVVQGVELRSTIPGIVNGSVGYTALLHTQVGANECIASGKDFTVVSENDYDASRTEILVVAQETENKPCRENFKPVYADLQGYVATEQGFSIRLDTNASELGVIELLGGKKGAGAHARGAVITNLAPRSVRDLGTGSEWVSLEVEATVLKGSNPCMAANTRLAGYGYTLDSQLRIAVKAETVDPSRVCTMEYAPVYETISFGAVYRPGSVKEIVVENKGEPGVNAVQALPGWAP